MAAFKNAPSERFRLTLVGDGGDGDYGSGAYGDNGNQRVVVQIGLDGLRVLSAEGGRAMRAYDLKHIARWQHQQGGGGGGGGSGGYDGYGGSSSSSLVLFTRTPVDVEERRLTLSGDSATVRSALDTLTCCCMQLAEILQQQAEEQEGARELRGLAQGNGRPAARGGGGRSATTSAAVQLPTADMVRYWHEPEKAGWLHCQGDVTRMWHRRWFVLKQGHLFRFMKPADAASDPALSGSGGDRVRGVVDLSRVQDVRDGRGATGRPHSIQLVTATGASVCYAADGETEAVEWTSALEGSVQGIVRRLAGGGGGGGEGAGAGARRRQRPTAALLLRAAAATTTSTAGPRTAESASATCASRTTGETRARRSALRRAEDGRMAVAAEEEEEVAP